MTATRRLRCAERVTLAFADEVIKQPHSSFSVRLGVRQAFSAATTFSNTFKTPKVQIRDQWSLCTLLINKNGKDSHSATDQVPKLVASLPRPTQELACEATCAQQISMAQRPLPCVAAVICVWVGWRNCRS